MSEGPNWIAKTLYAQSCHLEMAQSADRIVTIGCPEACPGVGKHM